MAMTKNHIKIIIHDCALISADRVFLVFIYNLRIAALKKVKMI